MRDFAPSNPALWETAIIPKRETPGFDIRKFRFFASINRRAHGDKALCLVPGSRRNAKICAHLVAKFALTWCGVWGRFGASRQRIFFAAGDCFYPRKIGRIGTMKLKMIIMTFRGCRIRRRIVTQARPRIIEACMIEIFLPPPVGVSEALPWPDKRVA